LRVDHEKIIILLQLTIVGKRATTFQACSGV
jgi:hypothetical protein